MQKKNLEKVKSNLDQKRPKSRKNENNEFELAQRMLDETTKSMQSGMNKEDMIDIKIPHKMLKVPKNFTNVKTHRNVQKKLRLIIGLK